jgi:hypothetical protein
MQRGFHEQASFLVQFRGKDMTPDVLAQLKKANFRTLSCGMETRSERLMAILDKGESVAEIKEGLVRASAAGFLSTTTFIFGIPTETRRERMATLKAAMRMPLDSARFNVAVPYPGTRLYSMALAEKRLNVAPNWENFNVQYYVFSDNIPYVPSTTGKFSLIFDTMWANIRFHLRPRIIKTILFKSDHAAGGVISMRNRRRKLLFYVNALRAALFIAGRFAYVAFRAGLEGVATAARRRRPLDA